MSFLRMGGKVNAVNLTIWNSGSNMTISHKIFYWILDSFALIDLKTLTRGFLRFVMTILKSDLKKKRRIQYGGHILKIQ